MCLSLLHAWMKLRWLSIRIALVLNFLYCWRRASSFLSVILGGGSCPGSSKSMSSSSISTSVDGNDGGMGGGGTRDRESTVEVDPVVLEPTGLWARVRGLSRVSFRVLSLRWLHTFV